MLLKIVTYICHATLQGPFLDSGFDHSKDRKNDYKSESSDG